VRSETAKLLRNPVLFAGLLVMVCAYPARGQGTVTAQVEVGSQPKESLAKEKPAKRKEPSGLGNGEVVVWLMPVDSTAQRANDPQAKRQKLEQIHKTFEPHLIVVEVGSVVDFPNRDPFFHNVFSSFEGKRFDLGLYEAGATNSVRFDRAGVSFLFCNIHPEMSAVVVAVDTPYYGISDRSGKVMMANVPDGRYEVHYWSERGLPDSLKQLTRTVTISEATRSLALTHIAENPNFTTTHKNKYGQDYVPPPSNDYPHP
jgi:plastocyanin